VARGEDEAVAVQPARLVGIVHEGVPVEDGADLSGAERQAEVAGIAFMHGVDGEAAGLIGCLGKNLSLELHEIGKVGSKELIRSSEVLQSPFFGIKKANRSGSLLFDH
jgi:hypothetical protein